MGPGNVQGDPAGLGEGVEKATQKVLRELA